ncbi:uncharacterized protein J4E84_005258 [Alternaria hordeiaustralica]|uniref:uncharacterized protein n=1 Tax=Alternaria hordeiaustralica TaxID=1187925 RepID=UPI0020C46979|nr:uncharacterized protein J4E84_005258 [Alternaria hordeiaustralica]KAI4686887.1 hypothetical protein J4E84_005258 [Alternaria hordeiaustralica]
MDSVELEEPYDEEGNFSYGHSEDDLDNDYTGSGGERSGEDRYANSESNGSDEAPDDASANDTDGELSDSVISENLSMSPSDDDEEDGELETGSMESDTSSSDEEDEEEVNDTGGDISGPDQGDDEEVNDTESDDISSDGEAVSIDEGIINPVSDESGSDSEADVSIGEGAGADTSVESVGYSGMCNNDSTTHHEQENVLTSTRSSPGGWTELKKGQNIAPIHHHSTYQAYQPNNNYQSTYDHQATNNYQLTNTHHPYSNNEKTSNSPTIVQSRKKVPRRLPEVQTVLDASTLNRSNMPAGVQKLAHRNEMASKKSKDDARRTNETHLSHRTKPNQGHAELPFATKHPRISKNLGKSKAGNEISMADELFIPVTSTQSTKSNPKPKTTKRSPLMHETERTPVATASHVSSKKKRKPTVLEMEGSAIQVPTNTKQQSNSKASDTKLSKNDTLRSHPRPPPVSSSDTEETWIPTSFSNPPKVLLNGIFAGVMMQRRKSTASIFDHASHAIIGFSMSKEQGKRYEEAGMKKYKAAKDGFTLWWKPYTPSADYFDRADEVE